MIIENKKGFTLIEVVVVMAIIAVLSALVVGAINVARRQARDTQRISDLNAIKTALIAYQSKHGDFVGAGSGCGWGGTGNGAFNMNDGMYGGSYTHSIASCLVAEGLSSAVHDPSDNNPEDNVWQFGAQSGYMKYGSGGNVRVYAHLENGGADLPTDSYCGAQCGSVYHMNYYVDVE